MSYEITVVQETSRRAVYYVNGERAGPDAASVFARVAGPTRLHVAAACRTAKKMERRQAVVLAMAPLGWRAYIKTAEKAS